MRVYLACLLMMLSGAALWGAPLLQDDFEYADGSLVMASNSVWRTHSGTTGQVQVVNGRAFLSQSNSEDVSISIPGGPYPASTNVALYVGFILQVKQLPTGSGDYLMHFKGTGSSGYAGRLFISTNGALSGTCRLGVSETAASGTYATNLLSLNTDYLVVLRYTVSNANTVLWIEPESETAGDAVATDAGTAGGVAALGLRETTAIGSVEIDLLRVGPGWADALPGSARLTRPSILQQPQSQIVTENAPVTLTVSATGSEPLSYQWLLGGSNVLGATSTALNFSSIQRAQGGEYSVLVSNRAGYIVSEPGLVSINAAPRPAQTVTVLSYNLKGNGVTDWSTNAAQVQAIGRQMAYLQPDILALNEVPYSQWWQMTNFIQAWLPGYALAGNSGTDGYVRSVILSRWPVIFSRSWLDGVSLAPYGSTNRFARDLFQAQIAVPFFPQPFNVFLAHLKATTDAPENDALRRGAEAAAISNFLVSVWLPTNRLQAYVLCGDLNEDVLRPDTNRYTSRQPIQTLTTGGTGLQLTTPTNDYTGSDMTLSIQTKMSVRFDYVLPCGLLWSNVLDSQVFRSDVLPNPPAPLLATDSATASDHLPVLITFGSPYAHGFRLLGMDRKEGTTELRWESIPGNIYRVECSSDLRSWSVLETGCLATDYTVFLATNVVGTQGFFRIYRLESEGL